MTGRTYTVGRSTITVQFGDITRSRAEVIVSSDDGDISRGGGVSEAINLAARGPSEVEIRKHLPARVGEVVVTPAEALPAKYVLHAITLPSFENEADFQQSKVPNGAVVRAAVQRIMDLLPLLRCRSVAFPSIGTGVAGVSFEDSAKEMSEVIVRRLLDTPEPLQVELYLYDRFKKRTLDDLAEIFEEGIRDNLGIRAAPGADVTNLVVSSTEAKSDPGEPPSDELRRQDILSMLLHLGRQRDRKETDLLAALATTSDVPREKLSSIRTALEEIERLREIYLRELIPGPTPSFVPNTVFVSSTYTDLVQQRQGISEVITRLGWKYVGMEGFIPVGAPPGDYIRRRVKECEVYLGLLGMRYGSIDPSSGFSMTELEYRQAVASNKPRMMFVMDKCASITLDNLEMNPEGFQKLMSFRQHVLDSHMCGMFCDLPDLCSQVEKALRDTDRRLRPRHAPAGSNPDLQR